MIITRDVVGEKLLKYIQREITLSELVDWSERMICEGEFDEAETELLRDILGHIGLADVKEFGLTWDDCCEYLRRLGYQVSVEAARRAS